MKKAIQKILLLACLLLAMTACSIDAEVPTETTESTAVSAGTTVSTDVTTVPTEETKTPTIEPTMPTDVTLPEDELPLATETSTEPITQPTEGQAQKPTDPTSTAKPEPTAPPATKPTEPPATQPTHKHNYKKGTTAAATCTEGGYTVYTCQCGDSYREEIKKLGHNYKSVLTEPTFDAEGYTTYTCQRCGCSYKDNYTDKLPMCTDGHRYAMTDWETATPEKDGFIDYRCLECGHTYTEVQKYVPPATASDVEKALLKYINQYRTEQGRGTLTKLSGMSKVAKYRAKQLPSNFSHNTADMREALAVYQYGRYIDMTEDGFDASYSYYTYDGQEAIGRLESSQDADTIGRVLATGFKNSSGHWSYVGNAENIYVGIGAYKSGGTWYVCVMVGDINYG